MSGGPAAQDYSSASCIWRTDVQKAASSVPSPVEAPDQTARAGYRAPWEEHTQREHTEREPKLELRLGGLQEPARRPWGGICPAAPCFVCLSSLSAFQKAEKQSWRCFQSACRTSVSMWEDAVSAWVESPQVSGPHQAAVSTPGPLGSSPGLTPHICRGCGNGRACVPPC